VKEAGPADALVTQQTGVYLGVLTADCVPMLFVAPERKLVAAVHAGWRGTLQGITEKLLALLNREHGIVPGELEAALGPSIGACCYEVKQDVTAPLIEKWGKLASAAIEAREGRSFLDLRSLNRNVLAQAGVPSAQIFEVGPCTGCAADDFFSYRRAQGETGRQLSFVGRLPQ
jgi:YfiH family protein